MSLPAHLEEANQRKTERAAAAVSTTVDDLIAQGIVPSVNLVARRSGVSRAFIYRKPALLEMIRQRQTAGPQLRRPANSAAVGSSASLRHRLADALDRIKELTAERDELRRQNAQLLAEVRRLRAMQPRREF